VRRNLRKKWIENINEQAVIEGTAKQGRRSCYNTYQAVYKWKGARTE
jgi:hypothetical protein